MRRRSVVDARKDYKNAIPNELFLLLAGRLHQRTPARQPGGYLDWALREWQWFKASGLIGPAGLVNDGLTAGCANNGGPTWTYNQGVIIGGLAVLHEITGDGAYLGPGGGHRGGGAARPDGAAGHPGRAGRAAGRGRDGDQPQFKGIFVRNLYELYRHSPRARIPRLHPGQRDLALATTPGTGADQVGLALDRPVRPRPTRAGRVRPSTRSTPRWVSPRRLQVEAELDAVAAGHEPLRRFALASGAR